jgi:predicted nucleic acid-binding protein
MNGNSFIADTNILLYLLKGDNTLKLLLDQKKIFISFITEIELLSFKKLAATETRIIRNLLSDCTIINIPPKIKEKAIELRQKYSLKIPDAIVASTASYLGFPLITSD